MTHILTPRYHQTRALTNRRFKVVKPCCKSKGAEWNGYIFCFHLNQLIPFRRLPFTHFLSFAFTKYVFTAALLAFTRLPFGIYHQLHYASVTNSYSSLDLYSLNPALADALGDISHLLNSLEKKKENAVCPLMWNIQNCNNITIATFCCTETQSGVTGCQHVHSSSPPQQTVKSSIPCLSHVSH